MTQKSEEKWKEVFIFREIENIQAYSFEAEIVIKKIFEEHPSLASKYKPIETT